MYRRVEMNLQHPAFNLCLEVLCSLSISGAHCRTLAMTLGLTARDLTEILRELRKAGYRVRRGEQTTAPSMTGFPLLSGHYAWIEPDGWPQAQADAESYWHEVYPGEVRSHE